MRIGVDVGGTNTDAVLMDGLQVLATIKTRTTSDISSGVVNAIAHILSTHEVEPGQIEAVMVGTTQFVNAFVQRLGLVPVAAVRVALPMSSGIPPLVDWPEELTAVIGENVFMIAGGSYYTGHDYIELDTAAIRQAAVEIRDREITSIAVSAVFSPIRTDLEIRTAEIIREIAGDVRITLSHEVGGIGLIERENAAIINASLQDLSRNVIGSLRRAMQELSLRAELYVSQNDGTLVNGDYAEQYPVFTCFAGPTNSIRGAAFLSGLKEAIVVDIGGTTTDVGVLTGGFPRETSDSSELGGVRTNFNMPDILSIALGGGTVVRYDQAGRVKLGPDSVGYRLMEDAIAFGGESLTATDIAIANGLLELGDPNRLKHLSASQIAVASLAIHEQIESAIDQLKTSAAEMPVILVGGGSVLINEHLNGASEVIRLERAPVANAIGAAIAQVGGRVKRIFDFGKPGGRDSAIEEAINEAKQHAIAAGALADTLMVVDLEEFPMTHMQTQAVDVRVRVVGDLDLERF